MGDRNDEEPEMTNVLGANQYGKAESRVVRVYRDTPRHTIRDLNVSTSLRGDFTAAHTRGDQAQVLPTDTQKNTAFAYAKKHGVTSPEDYAVALGRRLLEASPAATAAQIRVEEYAWDRIQVEGADASAGTQGHDHSFVRRGTETRTAAVTVEGRGDDEQVWVLSGLQDLVVLKSTGSEFHGFLKDEYTTLQETDDRVMATSLTARWRHDGTRFDVGPDSTTDWDASYDDVKRLLLATFAGHHSLALQQTLHAMGEAVLDAHPEIVELRFSAPNKHHFLVDFSPFGLENDGEVFFAADRPYGLIEATVTRDDASDPGSAWVALPGFC
jgi:urate oxidase